MPTSPTTWTWWHLTAAVNRRTGPSSSAKITSVQPKGHNFKCVAEVKGDGRTWLVTNTGGHYAKEYCAKGKAVVRTRVASPVPGHGVTTAWRKRPRNNTYWQTRGYHTGADYAARQGTDVVAVRAGRIVPFHDRVLGTVALLYADNGQTYWYCHLSAITKSNRKVKAGEVIGTVGSTGSGANGPHLHLERRSGHSAYWGGPDLDPMKW